MRNLLLLGVLCGLPALGAAAVYKWVDAEGTVHFSDTPREGAEEIHVAPAQTYTPVRLPPAAPRAEVSPPAPAYRRFELVSPGQDATVRDNTGNVPLSFAIEPPLDTAAGHKLVVLVDGQPRITVQGTSLTLENLDRGTHSLQGQIVDGRGLVLMSTTPVQVHIHRQSALLPNRARPTPTPAPPAPAAPR